MPGIDEKHVNIADARLLYNDLRGRAEAVVEVSDSEPTNESNKIWIHQDETGEHSVPTVAEMNAAVAGLNDGKADVIVTSASGAVASFTDAVAEVPVENCTVTITPTQSGTGDPSPSNIRSISGASGVKVTRAGKNLFDALQANNSAGDLWTVSAGSWANSQVSASNATFLWSKQVFAPGTYTFSSEFSGTGTQGVRLLCSSSTSSGTWNEFYEGYYITLTDNKYGTITVSEPFTLGIVLLGVSGHAKEPGTAYDLQLEVGSSATSYTAYAGSSCSVTFPVLGKNLLRNETLYQSGNQFAIGASFSEYPVHLTEGTYTLSNAGTGAYAYYKRNGDESSTLIHNSLVMYGSFTVSQEGDYQLWLYQPGASTTDFYNIMLCAGSSSQPYEPYTTTCYGGSLNLITGVLAVTWYGINANALTWETTSQSSNGVFRSNLPYDQKMGNTRARIICNKYITALPETGISSMADKAVKGYNYYEYGKYIYIRDSSYTTLETFTANIDATIVYELGEPQMYQLTPTQITTLLGQNNIFSDAGSTTVTYRADTKAYVDESIPFVPVQDVQVNGTSILSNGVANVPLASDSNPGVILINNSNGFYIVNGVLRIFRAQPNDIKNGIQEYRPITPSYQQNSVFYGLAKAAGDTTQSSSSNAVGAYTEDAKKAIRKMLGIPNTNWELIADVTVNADSTEIVADVDINGSAFKLQKLVAIFNANQSTTGTKDTFYGTVYYRSTAGSNTVTSFPSLSYPGATNAMAARIEIEACGDCPIHEAVCAGSSEGNSSTASMMQKGAVFADYITGLKIYQSASNKSLIPSGANLKIYGIRYDD